MTCVIGLKTKDGVLMGADSAAVSGWNLALISMPKIFKNNDFLFGCCGSQRMMQLLRFEFIPPLKKPQMDDEQFMCTEFIGAIRKCFKDGGFSEIENNVERGGLFIVGYNNRLYKIWKNFEVETVRDDFMAIGCGEHYALGVLKVTTELSPQERVKLALETAEYFSAGVRRPFTFLEAKAKGENGQ